MKKTLYLHIEIRHRFIANKQQLFYEKDYRSFCIIDYDVVRYGRRRY